MNTWRAVIVSLLLVVTVGVVAFANDYYTHGNFPSPSSPATSASMRAELDLISAGFSKLPTLTANANKVVVVNSGATGLTTTTGQLALGGNLTITGAFNTTLAQSASITLTLPGVSGTLATLAGTETLTNKTLLTPSITAPSGLISSDVGLGNVNNTSDATKDAAATTLTNKTLTTPTINGGTISSATLSGTFTGTYTLAGTPTFTDASFAIGGSSDASKKIAHEVDGLTTATVRTRFAVDEDVSDGQSWEVKNMSLVATVAGNAMTVGVKTKNGTDPSSTDPAIFKFRSATIGNGGYATVSLTAALSLVISSGSTLGTASAVAHRLYIGIANDGGTLRLFLYNPLVSATLDLAGVQDELLYSSTAEGGAGAADTAQVLYSGTAFTTKSVRLLGYVESTQATAGTWVTAPSKIQLMGPGVRRTGDVVQRTSSVDGAVATTATALPGVADDTIPQNTEGGQFLTKSITPTSTINLLRAEALLNLATATADQATVALFQDATANALAATQHLLGISARVVACQLVHEMQAGTVSSTTFNVRAGIHTGAVTVTFNGSGGARQMGGAMKSFLRITEIMV